MTKLFKKSSKKAFTMAEILLSLTIIGVVAAITLPSLTGNINERTWNTQRKALYARMSQAMALMPALNGMGTLAAATSSTSAADTAGQAFVTELGNVLKINNVCDNEHLEDCGFASNYTNYDNAASPAAIPATMRDLNSMMIYASYDGYNAIPAGLHSQLNTKAVAFETQNGESIAVYYNPSCKSYDISVKEGGNVFSQPYMCANFIYDLNGKKGPNMIGKDVGFMTAWYATDSMLVHPVPYNKKITGVSTNNAASVCTDQVGDVDYRVPMLEETASLWLNKKISGLMSDEWGDHIFSQTYVMRSNGRHARVMTNSSGEYRNADLNAEFNAICIKRY